MRIEKNLKAAGLVIRPNICKPISVLFSTVLILTFVSCNEQQSAPFIKSEALLRTDKNAALVSDVPPASIPAGCVAAYMFNYTGVPADNPGISRGITRITSTRKGGAATSYNTVSWGYGVGSVSNSFYNLGDNNAYSVPAGGVMSISVWVMPVASGILDVDPYPLLLFENTEQSGYVHWMGKGRPDNQEWAFRIYSGDNTENRRNRMSFYHWSYSGGKGPGCYVEEKVISNQWIHLVAIIDRINHTISYYKNGAHKMTVNYITSTYGIADSEIRNGTAGLQLGSKDGASFFKGAIDNLFIYHKRLSTAEIGQLYADRTP